LEWEDVQLAKALTSDWNVLAYDGFGIRLDDQQQEALYLIQHNKYTEIHSGHARGKDYLAAAAGLCFLNCFSPSKVICTGPTKFQAVNINMAEVSSIYRNSKIPLPGTLLATRLDMPALDEYGNLTGERETNHFLTAFKANDHAIENWTGFHSPNTFVIATEASGLDDRVFNDGIEGLMTGENPKCLLVHNPHHRSGGAYKAYRSKFYVSVELSCLDAPNVLSKTYGIKGQVGWDYVAERVERWCDPVKETEMCEEEYDFTFELPGVGNHWRPNDDFLVKIMGKYPREDSDQVIPSGWLDLAHDRWDEVMEDYELHEDDAHRTPLKLGVDVAGGGVDKTIATFRRGNVVEKMVNWPKPADMRYIHPNTLGHIKNSLTDSQDIGYIDAIGEGAGVFQFGVADGLNLVCVKGSESAKGLTCMHEVKTFFKMRSYLIWAIRDALDPKIGYNLALPRNEELVEELTSYKIKRRMSDGSILLDQSEDIKERIGRSPDWTSSLSMTFFQDANTDLYMIGGGNRK